MGRVHLWRMAVVRSPPLSSFSSLSSSFALISGARRYHGGFLVRAIVFDMEALIVTRSQAQTLTLTLTRQLQKEDWTTLVNYGAASTTPSPTPAANPVSLVDDIVQRLGVQNLPSIKERVGTGTGTVAARKGSPPCRTELEEDLLASGKDGIRVKYLERLRLKTLRAEARLQQEKMGFKAPAMTTTLPFASRFGGVDWQPLPSAPFLVQYLEDRGICQGLLVSGKRYDLSIFLEQLGSFKFKQIRHLQEETPQEKLQWETILRSMCQDWNFPPHQVMLVIGEGAESYPLLEAAMGSGFIICQIKRSKAEEPGLIKTKGDSVHSSAEENGLSLYARIGRYAKSFFLRTREQKKSGDTKNLLPHVHYEVMDLMELKWIIEDLNGVSYKRSTMLVQ